MTTQTTTTQTTTTLPQVAAIQIRAFRAASVGDAVLTRPEDAHLDTDQLLELGEAELAAQLAEGEEAETIEVGLCAAQTDASDLRPSRADQCTSCGSPGVRVDTAEGEVVVGGEVIAVAADGATLLRPDAAGRLVCDECAGS